MQRLALLDLDNTLVDRADAFRRWAAGFCSALDLPPDAPAWLQTADGDGFVPREEFFAAVRRRFGITTPVGDLWADYRRRKPRLATCRPAVLSGLDRLRERGWRVAVVTNGHRDGQLATIMSTGLDRHVDAWAVSGELGVRKPDRALFAAAADRCGLSLDGGGWVVGDSPEHDIVGGRGAGLATVWIERGRSWPDGLTPPDHTCGTTESALTLLSYQSSAA
jgi:putative hydrolase of the HAD superfamily